MTVYQLHAHEDSRPIDNYPGSASDTFSDSGVVSVHKLTRTSSLESLKSKTVI